MSDTLNVQPTSPRVKQTIADRNAYCRQYYKTWRQQNKDKIRDYQVNHWTKKIKQQVRSDVEIHCIS